MIEIKDLYDYLIHTDTWIKSAVSDQVLERLEKISNFAEIEGGIYELIEAERLNAFQIGYKTAVGLFLDKQWWERKNDGK